MHLLIVKMVFCAHCNDDLASFKREKKELKCNDYKIFNVFRRILLLKFMIINFFLLLFLL